MINSLEIWGLLHACSGGCILEIDFGLTSFSYIDKKIYQYFSYHFNGLGLFLLRCVEGGDIKERHLFFISLNGESFYEPYH